MVILLTVSGYTQDPKEFYNTTLQCFKEIGYPPMKSGAIIWDNPSLINRIEELINADDFTSVLEQSISQLGNAIHIAVSDNDRLVIVSYSAGSLITELALSTFENTYRPLISHIMLAPALSSSIYAKMGRLIQPAFTLALTKYAVDKTKNGWLKLIFGIVGSVTTANSIINSGVIKQISIGYNQSFVQDKVKRYVLFGERDNIVKKPNFEYPNGTYYIGRFNHNEVGDLSNMGLKQTYEIYKNNARLLKSHIIKEAITGTPYFEFLSK